MRTVKSVISAIQSVILAIVLAGSMAVQADARDQGINGLLLGAGGGALAGQAIGRDTEGTLVGAAVGGMVGYMVGNEMDKRNYDRGYVSAQPAVFPPPPPPRDIVPAAGDMVLAGDIVPATGRYHYGSRPRCERVVSLECWHGRCREVVKTVCWERDRWNRHWHGDRHWRDKHRHDYRHPHWRDNRWKHHDPWRGQRDRHRHHR